VASVEKMLEDARQLDLSSVDGCFRLGDLAEAMCRELPVAVDLFERLAVDLGVDRNFLTEAWYVATAFPPTTRPPGLPWASYLLLRFHAERHELAECAAREGWPQEDVERELAVRFAATHAQAEPLACGLRVLHINDGSRDPSRPTDREYQTRRGIWLPPRAPLRLGTASPAAPRPGPCSRPRTGRCRGQAAHTAALGGRVKDAARSFGPAFGRP
jgi:hypothetical protein